MNGPKRDIQADLDALAAGELDALSPQQIERLEACVHSQPEAAERLAEQTPPIEPLFRISAESPSEDVWERLWQRVEAGAPARGRGFRRRLLQLWRPMLAAATVALLVGFWDRARPPAQPDWPVEWAREVEINELEVSEGAAPFVLVGGMDDSVSVIWVLDAEG